MDSAALEQLHSFRDQCGRSRAMAKVLALGTSQMRQDQKPHERAVPIDLFHCIEHRRTTRAMGNPTQKMCMTTPITNSCKENGYFMALERGTTTRFMKK